MLPFFAFGVRMIRRPATTLTCTAVACGEQTRARAAGLFRLEASELEIVFRAVASSRFALVSAAVQRVAVFGIRGACEVQGGGAEAVEDGQVVHGNDSIELRFTRSRPYRR